MSAMRLIMEVGTLLGAGLVFILSIHDLWIDVMGNPNVLGVLIALFVSLTPVWVVLVAKYALKLPIQSEMINMIRSRRNSI